MTAKYGTPYLFQSLLGRLVTFGRQIIMITHIEFQSLIGRLVTHFPIENAMFYFFDIYSKNPSFFKRFFITIEKPGKL